MRQFPLGLALAILAALTFCHTANADDDAARSEELQVLDRFVGTWDIVVTVKLTEGEAITTKTSETRKWSLGGQFLHSENLLAENPEAPEFHSLTTYDPATQTYPSVMMIGTSRMLVSGTWDRETKTMTFTGSSADDGMTFVFANRFIDKDHSESTGVFKNANGDVFLEMTQTQTRRSK